MKTNELTYWFTLAAMTGITTETKNSIYVGCFKHQPRISIIELFDNPGVLRDLGLDNDCMALFESARSQLANNAFFVEELLAQGYRIIPFDSEEYPALLKRNLKIKAPTVIYAKGNVSLLNKSTVAVVGSRNADDISLEFTGNVAGKLVGNDKVVVSGFAKGVDRYALDSAVAAGGESIIVLPQGIMTFAGGFRQYYKEIHQGKVLVISTFHPKVPWSAGLAMARNEIIYGMADEIYVARSDDKGGTWSGAVNGLRKSRKVYVRSPEPSEKNANMKLIRMGGIPVDLYGNHMEQDIQPELQEAAQDLDTKLKAILSNGPIIAGEISCLLKEPEMTDADVRKYLRSADYAEECRIGRKIGFRMKGSEPTLL